MPRPLLFFSIIFIAGIYLGAQWAIPLTILMGLAGLLLLGAVAAYLGKRDSILWLLLAACLVIGMATTRLFDVGNSSQLTQWHNQPVTVAGEIVQEPDVRADKVFYILDVEQVTDRDQTTASQGLLRLTVHNPQHIFNYGEEITAQGKLQQVMEPGNPGQFDYRQYLARRGIHVIMSAWQEEQVESLGIKTTGLLGWSLKAKAHLQELLTATLPPDHNALIQGMLFGNRGMISDQVNTAFQMTSLVHILCVSGFHVSLVLGAVLLLLRLFNIPLRGQAPIGTVVIFFYAVITGMGPAVLRAAMMGLMVLWARHFGRERDWPTAMALAGAVVLLIWPYGLWEPGFQLSFIVTGGILYFVPRLIRAANGRYLGLVAIMAVPLVAEITALPLVAYHFNMVSLVGVVANIATGPIIIVVMMLSGLSLLVGLLYLPLATLINHCTSGLLDLMLWIINSLAASPQSVFFVASFPLVLAIAFYLLLFSAPRLFNQLKGHFGKTTLIKTMAAVTVGLVAVLVFYPTGDGKHLTLHFIDVGQGDAALLQTPSGKTLLIDTGGWRGELETGQGVGTSVVLPYLKRQGINRLDVLMLTHPHEDHVGGARGLIQQMPIKLAVVASVDDSNPEVDPAYWELLEQLGANTAVKQGWQGHSLQLDEQVQMKVISPPRGVQALNNGSLVVMVKFQQTSILFTGDIEKECQQLLVAADVDLQAQILKVPHHGSGNMAAEFFQAVNPKVAVISVGENNKFGHPAPALLQLLEDNGSQIYRTDRQGAIVLKSDGKSTWVDTGRDSAR